MKGRKEERKNKEKEKGKRKKRKGGSGVCVCISFFPEEAPFHSLGSGRSQQRKGGSGGSEEILPLPSRLNGSGEALEGLQALQPSATDKLSGLPGAGPEPPKHGVGWGLAHPSHRTPFPNEGSPLLHAGCPTADSELKGLYWALFDADTHTASLISRIWGNSLSQACLSTY